MSEFFEMGGYARYVWPAWGIVFACIVLNIYLARRALDRARFEARKRVAMKAVDAQLKGEAAT